MPSNTIYVRVSKNKFRLKNIDSGREQLIESSAPFTTSRLLVGQFNVAEQTLKRAFATVVSKGVFALAPRVVIHPLEMVEGGLAEVEERAMRELAMGAGSARKVLVWTGHELSDAEVKEKMNSKTSRAHLVPDRALPMSRLFRLLAAVICLCAAIASITILLMVSTGYRPLGELYRLPFTLFIACVAGYVAARGAFPAAKSHG